MQLVLSTLSSRVRDLQAKECIESQLHAELKRQIKLIQLDKQHSTQASQSPVTHHHWDPTIIFLLVLNIYDFIAIIISFLPVKYYNSIKQGFALTHVSIYITLNQYL